MFTSEGLENSRAVPGVDVQPITGPEDRHEASALGYWLSRGARGTSTGDREACLCGTGHSFHGVGLRSRQSREIASLTCFYSGPGERIRTADLPLTRSFHVPGPTAACLLRAGLLVAWLLLATRGFRPVLARGWHGPLPYRDARRCADVGCVPADLRSIVCQCPTKSASSSVVVTQFVTRLRLPSLDQLLRSSFHARVRVPPCSGKRRARRPLPRTTLKTSTPGPRAAPGTCRRAT